MRWPNLFDDLEAQLSSQHALERAAEDAERVRANRSKQTLTDRLAACMLENLEVLVEVEGRALSMRLTEVGSDWIAGNESRAHAPPGFLIIPVFAIDSIELSQPEPRERVESARSSVARRLSIASPLRDLARRRRVVTIETSCTRRVGTIDAVGADHLELAVQHGEFARRGNGPRPVTLVPFRQLLIVRG